MVFSKAHPACHNIANGIKPESNSKTSYKHAADGSKAVYDLCVMYNCSYNNVAK